MYKNITYGNHKLEKSIREKHVIPYSLGRDDKYIKNMIYFNDFNQNTFKVLYVKYSENGELEGAEIRYDNGMHSYICTDIDPGYDYRIEKDFKNICDKSTIVNDGNVYSGAEIIYWFFINNISCFDRKYKGFWKNGKQNGFGKIFTRLYPTKN